MKPAKILALALLLLAVVVAVRAAPGDNFRILTGSLPDGSEDAEYAATLVTANGGGPVAFGVSAGALPPGLGLDPDTGRVAGIPTAAGQYSATLSANDGLGTVELPVTVTIGPAGAAHGHLSNTDLDQGRVGTVYYDVLVVQDGVGPFVAGTVGLPPGLTLNGLTGQIQGTPTVAGTYDVRICVTDLGDGDHRVVAALPLVVLPGKSDIAFTTVLLRNGEVDRPYFDSWGAGGNPSFDSTGLPPDLALDAKSGDVTGIPTTPGTFHVSMSAKSRGDTIVTTLPITIVPSTTSRFHWASIEMPPAFSGLLYGGQSAVRVATRGGTSVVHSAAGLPEGVSYDPGSGEITGTAVDVGIYPVVFQATDQADGTSLTLGGTFVVLPPDGGDAKDVAVNMWVTRQVLGTGRPGRDYWKGKLIYNADRRTGRSFDPLTDRALLSIGSRRITLDPGDLDEIRPGVFAYKNTEQDGTVVSVKVYASKQILKVATKRDSIPDKLNQTLVNEVILGSRGYSLEERFKDGRLQVTPGYRSVAFVVDKLKLRLDEEGTGTIGLRARLAVPGLLCEPGTALRLRVLDGAQVLLDKDLTDLIGVHQVTDVRTKDPAFVFKKNDADDALVNRLAKLKYDSRSGKLVLTLKDADLSGISPGEAHLAFELTVGDRAYHTAVTVFDPLGGRYSTKMPKR